MVPFEGVMWLTAAALVPGNVIRNRGRLWRVDAQYANELVATSIDGGVTEQHRFFVPLEAIEPGHLGLPRPELVGTPPANDLLLRGYRLSMMHGSAPFLGLQRSCVIPTNYQLVPVVMALELPRVRMLLADDVGLGKTIEAGLIITELLARQRVSRVLVICPASLREQWREALDQFFHLDARIISTRHERELQRQLPAGANPWEFYRYLVISVDYAKLPRIKFQVLELLAREAENTVVVIDEAHTCAKPHQTRSDEHVEMQRWELAEEVSASTEHLLLLTATPHNGYTDSYASLLRMLDDGLVTGEVHAPGIMRKPAKSHVCQRRREDVEQWFAGSKDESPFPERDQDEVMVEELTSEEREAIRSVREYGRHILERAEGHHRFNVARWAVLHLQKRALSSPAALRESLKNRKDTLLAKLEQGLAGDDADGTVPEDIARANALDNDTGERFTEEEAGARVERQAFGDEPAIRAELQELDYIMPLAKKVTPAKDSKLRKLIKQVLPERLSVYPKAIVFTKYKDTLDYVAREVGKAKELGDLDVVTLDGSLSEAQRRERFLEFERSRQAVLIATDCISEGLNLQHAAAQIVHYELPWNPNRLEQRNGRVDRFGQPKDTVYIRTLVMNDTLDALILKVLVEKAARIRAEYGFSPPYFGSDESVLELIESQGLRVKVEGEQLSMLFEEGTEEVPDIDLFPDEVLERMRSDSFYGQTEIDLRDVEQGRDKTYETIGSPQQIERFVLSALNRFQCPVTDNDDGTLQIQVSDPNLQSAATESVIARATFDPALGLDDPDVTVLDLAHPLVRRLIDVVKHSAFDDGEHYGRAAYRCTEAVPEVTALVHVLARYAVHTDPVAVLEELVPVAFPVYSDGLLAREDAEKLFEAQATAETLPDEEVSETLSDLLNREDLDELIGQACEELRDEIVAERREFKERLAERGTQSPEWLQGIDHVSLASTDALTITVFYPR